MASTNSAPLAPLTEEAFTADRMAFWASFNTASMIGIVAVVALVVGMWIFLV